MIKVLIADDHPIVREGLKRILNDCPDMRIVGEAGDGRETIKRALDTEADVLLLDISMPGPGFLETLGRVRSERPALRVLVLSVQPEENYAVRALAAGAAGYLTKERSPGELAQAIRRVRNGRKYVTASLAEALADRIGTGGERAPHERLSNREYEIFCRLGTGKSVTAIAAEMTLSAKTVSTYRARILDKMGLASNAEIIRYALEHSLV